MSLTIVNSQIASVGNVYLSRPVVNLGIYATGGFSLSPALIQLNQIQEFWPGGNERGYFYQYNFSTNKLQVYDVSGVGLGGTAAGQVFTGTAASLTGTNGTSTAAAQIWTAGAYTPAGTNSAPTFTGTSPTSDLNLATPAFSGTGLTAAAQVLTTTDNQTMTLNQCAGMWLISSVNVQNICLILSNTAVVAAPAVLTVQGVAATDVGTYKILKSLTPVGTVSAPTFTGTAASLTGTNGTSSVSAQTWTAGAYTPAGTNAPSAVTGGGAIQYAEVANGTDLSAVTNLFLNFIGL